MGGKHKIITGHLASYLTERRTVNWSTFVPCKHSLLLEAITLLSAPCALLECSHALSCKALETLPPCSIMWGVVPQRSGTHICPCQKYILKYAAPVLTLHQLASLLQHTFLPM
jgi:hypothetical protein